MDKQLHIVCLDTPYPADYGGAFATFYMLKWLSQLGIKIHLHCFEYGRGRQHELEKYCQWVHYYPRKSGWQGMSLNLPYIVSSRAVPELLTNLNKDRNPILLDGIHTSYYLYHQDLTDRKVLMRLHNVEWKYYSELRKTSRAFFSKLYYGAEAMLLKKYERRVAPMVKTLAIAPSDADTYKEIAGANVEYLPVFVPWERVGSKEGLGSFCLYHGNLSVPENEKAVEWLIREVFRKVEVPFVIAGKRPSARIEKLARNTKNTCLVADPSVAEINDLIEKAQIHVLPSFNNTGIKLKLLHALFCGRHCIVNEKMVEKTGLDAACHMAEDAETFRSSVTTLFQKPFSAEEISTREALLRQQFDNVENAKKLIAWIW